MDNPPEELPKFLPMNVRIKLTSPLHLNGLPAIMCCLPTDPLNPMAVRQVPGRLEIQLVDPTTKELVWMEVPFHMPPPEPPSIRDIVNMRKPRERG